MKAKIPEKIEIEKIKLSGLKKQKLATVCTKTTINKYIVCMRCIIFYLLQSANIQLFL